MDHSGHDSIDTTTTMATANSASLAAVDHSSHGADSSSGHSFAFHFGSTETILFGFWNISSAFGLILSWMIIVLVCISYEALKWYRMQMSNGRKTRSSSVQASDIENKPVATQKTPLKMMQNRKQNYRDIMRYLYTALNALQLLLGYLLMLIFMTFNVWLCSAVIIGDAIGYFIFFGGPTANQEEEEDSHITCN